MMPGPATIVLVGHCGPDMHLLKSVVSRVLHGARIVGANDAATLERLATPGAILLINRMLDGDFSDDSGIELIRALRHRSEPPTMLLISNYESAQAAAVAEGAMPGFGKSKLHHESTAQRLRDAMAASKAR